MKRRPKALSFDTANEDLQKSVLHLASAAAELGAIINYLAEYVLSASPADRPHMWRDQMQVRLGGALQSIEAAVDQVTEMADE